ISVYDDDFENIEYVEASPSDPEIVSVEEENEEVDLEDISQVQDVVLREKLFSITRLISNIKSLNDNSTPDRALNSFESDNSLLDNFSPEFETFCDHSEETRSGNTTHVNYSLPEYDSFCFEIEPDKERLINLMKNNVPDNSSNDPLLEEADLFLSDDSIPPGIENVADDPEGDVREVDYLVENDVPDNSSNDPLLEEVDLFLFDNSIPPCIENVIDDPEGDIHFLEELLINDSILSRESSDSNFEDNPSNLRPPPEPPDDNFDLEPEVISAVMEDIDEPDEHFNPGGEIFVSTHIEDVDYFPFMFVIQIFFPYLILPEISPLLLSAESEDTIFDPGLSSKVEDFLCRILSWFSRPSYLLIDSSLGKSLSDNPSNLRPPLEPPDDNFYLEPEVISAVMEDIDEPDEHFNPGGEIFVSTNIEYVDYFPFMFVIRIFLPYLILPEISPLFLSLRVRTRSLILESLIKSSDFSLGWNFYLHPLRIS
nr:hypothetical protein [Tanacetum cinerariifolium]